MIRAILIGTLRGYRRWLSGRGPLRRVRCSFADETCGAFGLRTAREAPSTWTAVARIRRRLRRCRDASVYALPGGALGWGRDHDRPVSALTAELVADGEAPATRARVLAARELVARWRGDVDDLVAVRAARVGLPPATVTLRAAPRPPRGGPGVGTARVASFVAVAVLTALAALTTAASPGLVVALALGAALMVVAAARRRRAHRHRLVGQARAATLRGAVPTLAPGPESRYETA